LSRIDDARRVVAQGIAIAPDSPELRRLARALRRE